MNQDKKITAGAFAITVLVTLPFSGVAVAETVVSNTETSDATITATSGDIVVDISNWKCEDCAFEEGFSAELELGIGNVSDPSYKFGEYNGLYEDGAFLILNGKARYRGEDANYYDLSVEDLGLDSRSLDIEGGRQGRYKAFFRYDEINHAISDSIMTPYAGNGTDTLSLPSGWTTAGNTGGMTDLASSLQSFNVEQKRKRMDIGFSFIQASHWKYDLKYRHETREGSKRSAGSFSFNAAQMIEPVDYVTDQIDASASYIGKRWQATLAYYGSFFSNENKSLTWENAYTSTTGADSGQRALAPDNLFHQLILSAGYQISDKTRLSGDISMGRMEQDEDLLPATINSTLAVPTLPRDSAEAQVDTLNANIRVISSLSDKLRLNASFNYSDHDNQTPQDAFTRVRTDDVVVLTPTTNQPYSFTRQETKLAADYRYSKTSKVSAGIDYDSLERTLQEVDKTTETTTWGKLIVRGKDFMDMTFKLAQAERDVSNYQVVPEIDSPQNPLLRKYNMADRSRTTAGATVNAMLGETVSLGGGIDYADDDYSESTLGLIDARELSVNADASAILTEKSSMHVFASQERIESHQVGSNSPNWYAENDDTVNTIGIGYKHRIMEDRLDLGVDYAISQSTGKINILFSADESFPDLEVDLQSIKLYADYRMKNNMSVHTAYWYESYDTKDWSLDNVDPDTVSNVLGFGELSPSYDVSVITVSLRYKF